MRADRQGSDHASPLWQVVLNIGIFTDTYKPQTDGVVVSIGIFQEELEKRGHKVFIFAPAYAQGSADPPNVFRFKSWSFPPYPEYKLVLPFSKTFKASDLPSLKLDILHVQTPIGLGFLGLYWARRYRVPAVFTYHTYFDQYVHYLVGPKAFYRWLIRSITRWYSNFFPLVLTPSQPIKEALQSYGITSRIETLPTGINLQRSKPSGKNARAAIRKKYGVKPGCLLFSTAGRLGQEKSFDLLLRAFRLVADTQLRAKLVIMGDGPEREELWKLMAELGLGHMVHFAGLVTRQQVIDTFAASDLFVFASQSETQGMVVVEALSQGTPAVAVKALGPADMLRGNYGGLLAEANERDLADKMLQLAKHPALRRKKAVEAKKRANEVTSGKMAERLLGFYKEVIAMKP
jgi:glycosyltransferase involved in cell wall biosynthesis